MEQRSLVVLDVEEPHLLLPLIFQMPGRAHADVTVASASANRMYMYPPKVTTAERGSLSGVTAGAMVYNISVNRLQVYNGSTWKDCFT